MGEWRQTESVRYYLSSLVAAAGWARQVPASTLALLAVLILVEGEVGTSTNTPQDPSAYPVSGDQYST